MSNNGQRPLYPWRAYKPPQGSQSPTGYFAQQSAYPQRAYAPVPSAVPQPLSQSHYAYTSERDARVVDQPSATFSRANRDRGLSNVFASNSADPYRRPQSNAASRMPQSSAGYQDIPGIMSQDMSISEASTGGLYQERLGGAYTGPSSDRVPKLFTKPRGAFAGGGIGSYHSDREPLTSIAPALHVKFRRISEALSAEGISFPTRSSQLTADHAIQAFAHFYGLFLPMPPDFPHLDFTIAGAHQATRLKRGIEAVNGLLEDLCYDDRRQTIAEMANLSHIEHPHRTVSAIFWLMDLAQQACHAVPKDEQEEIPSMDQSLVYAEYAVRMIFASSVSNFPEVTVPEARAYIDAALSRFRIEKEQAIAKCRAEIKAAENDQAEQTKVLESEEAKLAELESRCSQLEDRKHELLLKLAPAKSALTSLQAEFNKKNEELQQSRDDFEAMKTKLIGSGIESPQRALELATNLQAQQDKLEKMDGELQKAISKQASEQEKPVSQQLDEVISLSNSYNEGVPSTLTFPDLPKSVDDFLGKSAADFLGAQKMLAMIEKWKRSIKEEESNVTQLKKRVTDVEIKIASFDKSLISLNQETVQLRVTLEQLSSEYANAEREVQQFMHQLRAREAQVQGHRPQTDILEKQESLRKVVDKVKAAEESNNTLESKMRKCADRKREIRVLLETYKAAYARLIDGIGQRESVIRQQEQTVSNLQQVLKDFVPPNQRRAA